MAGLAHVPGVGAWFFASPRVQRAIGSSVGAVMTVGMASVVAHRPDALRKPLTVAVAVAPVDRIVEQPAAAAEVHVAPAAAARSKPAPRPAAKPRPSSATTTKEWAALSARIRGCESGSGPNSAGDYKAENPSTSASGAYQIVDSTWAGRYGVEHASDATPEQQDAAAYDLYQRRGTADWAASASCWR
jgi:transglycosylase-like protein